MDVDAQLRRSAVLLAVIQLFFAMAWILYVLYLGELLERIGIGKNNLVWFIVADQVIFVICDTLMGYSADRMERLYGRFGPALVSITGLSCLAFLLIPVVANAGAGSSTFWPAIFTALTLVWIATSSVLRAPPLVLLMKYAAQPKVPNLAALSLLGLAFGGAVSPYLGIYLAGIDPRVPFVITSVVLFVATLALVRFMRPLSQRPATVEVKKGDNPYTSRSTIVFLLLGTLFIAFGFQVHSFLNSTPQYLHFVDASELVFFLPLFWVGFKLSVFPGSAAASKLGSLKVLTMAALAGGVGLYGATLASDLQTLVTMQLLAGGAWGVFFMAGISAALGLGRSGREGLILGLWFSMLSLATLARAGMKVSGASDTPLVQSWLPWMPGVFWGVGAMFLLLLVLLGRSGMKLKEV